MDIDFSKIEELVDYLIQLYREGDSNTKKRIAKIVLQLYSSTIGGKKRFGRRDIFAETPELSEEDVQRYLYLYTGDYRIEDDARIRMLLIALREKNPREYSKIKKLLEEGEPWSILVVGVLDRVANNRGTELTLSKLWAAYTAYKHRDPYYVYHVVRKRDRELAHMLWEVIYKARSGDQEAKKILDSILDIAYSPLVSPPDTDIIGGDKIEAIRRLLEEARTRHA